MASLASRENEAEEKRVNEKPAGNRAIAEPIAHSLRWNESMRFGRCCPRTVEPATLHLPQRLEQAALDGSPRRHQVTEVPPIRARIIEYQCHGVICQECGERTRALLPEDVAGQFGPQLTALIAYLTVVCRMPRRVVEALLKQVLAIDISLGSTQKCWEEASEAVAAPCRELEQELKNEPVLNVDETGWRTNGYKRFRWALCGLPIHRLHRRPDGRQRSTDSHVGLSV